MTEPETVSVCWATLVFPIHVIYVLYKTDAFNRKWRIWMEVHKLDRRSKTSDQLSYVSDCDYDGGLLSE
jgi:hypothetical protein